MMSLEYGIIYTFFDIKQMLFGVMHKASNIFVCSTELFVLVTLEFNLLFLDSKLKAQVFILKHIV